MIRNAGPLRLALIHVDGAAWFYAGTDSILGRRTLRRRGYRKISTLLLPKGLWRKLYRKCPSKAGEQ